MGDNNLQYFTSKFKLVLLVFTSWAWLTLLRKIKVEIWQQNVGSGCQLLTCATPLILVQYASGSWSPTTEDMDNKLDC